MNVFIDAPEFIDLDNRRFRTYSPISVEQMQNKHDALLPASIVSGKTVLDVGCGLGATGHWCLSNGARSYTGVEVQHEYAVTASELLERYHSGASHIIEQSFDSFLTENRQQFDVVTMLAVLHASTDLYGHLEAICGRAREIVAIEELLPRALQHDKNFCGIEYSERERTNIAGVHASLEGRGARISPLGLSFIMKDFGFESDGVIVPKRITDTIDNFNEPQSIGNARYLMRFTRSAAPTQSVSHDLALGNTTKMRPWTV